MTIASCGGGDGGEQGPSADSAASTDTSTAPTGSTSDDSTPGATDAEVAAAALARTDEVMAMGEDDREAALLAAGMELELDVAKASGLEAALGGREATRAALGAAWAPLVEQARAIDVESLSLGFRRGSPAPSIGEGLFGALMVVSLGAAVGVTNEIPAGPPVSEDNGKGFVITGSQNSASLSYNGTHTDSKTGVTTKLETNSTVVPCPDANGTFDASALVDVTVTKGDAGQHGTLDVNVVGQVDDDAHLASSDLEFQMQWSKSGGGSAELVDVSMKVPSSGDTSMTVNRTGGAVSPELVQGTAIGGLLYAMLIREGLLKAAQQGWESGRCVRLDVTPQPAPKDMEPSSTAEITAAPRSKIDGSATGGTVTATLISGGTSVDPSAAPVPADANMTYTAHSEPNNHGTVALEARSKRGVAKAELTFETRGPASFQIVGGLDDFQTNEAVCDVMKPFQLTGGGITASYSGGLTGTYSYTGPFNATGGGTYTISLPNGPTQPGTMVGQGEGTVDTPLGQFGNSGTENFTLTPITGCID
ncbi:MAG TPA: hypothetical protein VFV63_14935 [Ilumatobacteraceae bacterium]|nr:hypothetical protein [Ilumatobacteraceae bacterium]